MLALCSVDADMFNFVDEAGQSLVGTAGRTQAGGSLDGGADGGATGCWQLLLLLVTAHLRAADSVWANPYRIGWSDMKRHWSRPEVNLIEPFVTVDLASGQYVRNHPAQVSDASQITAATGDDNGLPA